jgi:hypothetical protein
VLALGCTLLAFTATGREAAAGANPAVPFYGYGAIVANPNPAVLGETTQITVTIANPGDAPATNVRVKLSFNDWGVTFFGWQEIDTVTIPTIAPGGSATASYTKVFANRVHTCLEALIVAADQDDDPNDDRGQINLEVINAGEVFSYNVPVVNNGDQPLNLLVRGRPGRDNPPANGVVAPPIEAVLLLQPGEVEEVPVRIAFAPGTPVGTAAEYIVDAFDLGSGAPLLPANRNHVLIRVVFETPRHLKQVALNQLRNMQALVPDRDVKNRLDGIADKIARSLDPALWTDDSHLVPAAGSVVFAQEQAAMNQLLNLVPRLPAAMRPGAEALAANHVDADRILAQVAAIASGRPDAEADVAAGDLARQAGDYPAAIRRYADAWRKATR